MDSLYQKRSRTVANDYALAMLSQMGTEKKILTTLFARKRSMIDYYWRESEFAKKSRAGRCAWLKTDEGRLISDRILNLAIKMYGKAFLDRTMYPTRLLDLFLTYTALYPGNQIHPNHVYYFFNHLREQRVGVLNACACCGKPYTIEYTSGKLDHFYECAACLENPTVARSLKDRAALKKEQAKLNRRSMKLAAI
ncbi:hypothetical protein [Pseudoalteromonas rubra]|uniref:Flagellar transcriptional regulator FlhC n=1 Tax=Pseudoalteromonas rubra TaxID=43658 RepID=A0A0U3IDG9_9GAMM|nr:hypothetical protein [Pseudoalteromonas rubra]ALU46143.1 hypothetical protein AT705_24585 [Pseudoalteromonas rubra]